MIIETTIEITKPPSDVYQFLCQDENLTLWVSNLVRSERIKGDDGEVGTITKLVYNENGKKVTLEEEVTEIIENESIRANLHHDQTVIAVQYEIMPTLKGTTLLKSKYEYQPKNLFFKMYLSWNKNSLTQRYQEDLEQLKHALESLDDDTFFED